MTPRTWVPVPDGSGFPITNLPYGIFTVPGERARVGVRIGDHVLDLGSLAAEQGHHYVRELHASSLNALMALGPRAWAELRGEIIVWLSDENATEDVAPHLVPVEDVSMRMPFEVADYVDFYSSEHHARNIGRILRPGQEPLQPNWKHLPVGYHGRAGTVVPSGTSIVRPVGQRKGPEDETPTVGPSERLDLEAEVGFVVGVQSPLGEPVPASAFADHVFGVCLVNDWSARDIQAWEYVPLGPFLGKSFATSVSPWIVPLAALEAARVAAPARDVPVPPYLEEQEPWGLDLTLEVRLSGHLVSRPPFAEMYWTAAQQLAHLTVNGASLRTGDLYASGTVSGAAREEWGSLMELTSGGAEPLVLRDGTSRTFLEDGDEVTITATAPGAGGTTIGFGEVTGRIEPAR